LLTIICVDKWLTTYIDANPNRSMYGFCIDNKHPGYFWLCFKANKSSRVNAWSVRVIPHAYELMKAQYPDVRALSNGFKLRYSSESLKMQQGGR
jgi:transcription elongation factor SPT6